MNIVVDIKQSNMHFFPHNTFSVVFIIAFVSSLHVLAELVFTAVKVSDNL